jgi:PAS domain S-box-containing protein
MQTAPRDALGQLADHLSPVLDESPDGVYLWLDEANKTCNLRLAKMFGYTVEEWEATTDFAHTFVAAEDRGMYVWNYQNRVLDRSAPTTFRFRGRRKDGSTFDAETDMIPLAFGGHLVAYHFVREVHAP